MTTLTAVIISVALAAVFSLCLTVAPHTLPSSDRALAPRAARQNSQTQPLGSLSANITFSGRGTTTLYIGTERIQTTHNVFKPVTISTHIAHQAIITLHSVAPSSSSTARTSGAMAIVVHIKYVDKALTFRSGVYPFKIHGPFAQDYPLSDVFTAPRASCNWTSGIPVNVGEANRAHDFKDSGSYIWANVTDAPIAVLRFVAGGEKCPIQSPDPTATPSPIATWSRRHDKSADDTSSLLNAARHIPRTCPCRSIEVKSPGWCYTFHGRLEPGKTAGVCMRRFCEAQLVCDFLSPLICFRSYAQHEVVFVRHTGSGRLKCKKVPLQEPRAFLVSALA